MIFVLQLTKDNFDNSCKIPPKKFSCSTKANAQCPAPIPLYIPVVKHTFHIDLSALCQVLEIMGYVVAIFAMVHGIAILVENS